MVRKEIKISKQSAGTLRTRTDKREIHKEVRQCLNKGSKENNLLRTGQRVL